MAERTESLFLTLEGLRTPPPGQTHRGVLADLVVKVGQQLPCEEGLLRIK